MTRWSVPVGALIVGSATAAMFWFLVPRGADPTHLAGEADPVGENPFEEATRGEKPNVLFIVWDTVRADRMSVYGHERDTTPNIARWADERGLVFQQARSPGIWTLPSHASMFTGLPPESTGADERWLWLDTPHVTMAEHFQDNGYNTFSLAANTLLSQDTNLVQGFHVPMNTFKGKLAPIAKKLTGEKLLPGDVSQELAPGWTPPAHGATNAEWARAAYKEAAPMAARVFLRWLDNRPRKETPFFAFINLMEAHTPRLPSMEAREAMMGDDPGLIELGLKTDASHINLHFYNFGKHDYTERELEAIRGVYDASLYDLDRATGFLLGRLKDRGDLDNTIVVLTSDHGENLGDHHLFNHRFTLADSLAHVPLIVSGPGIERGEIETPVSTMDIFPTLCAWSHVPVPKHLSGHLTKAPRPAVTRMELPLRREIETVQAIHPDVQVEPWIKSGHAMVDADLQKLVRWDGGDVLSYDLHADPGEEQPGTPSQHQVKALQDWTRQVPPYDPEWRTEADDPVHVRASQEELKAHLEALGYIQE